MTGQTVSVDGVVRVALIFTLLFAACGVTPRGGSGGGGQGICPDHPDQCGGKCCGTLCQDVSRDPQNCGDCNAACPDGTICLGASCGCPPHGDKCSLGQSCCGALGCVSLGSDIRNCGHCGTRCPDGGLCMNGQCSCNGVPCQPVVDPSQSTAPPPGFCACSDSCAGDPKHQCIGPNCCYADYLEGKCSPAQSCGAWTYK